MENTLKEMLIAQFDERIAERPDLTPDRIIELKDSLEFEMFALDLEDPPPTQIDKCVKEIVDRLLGEIKSSATLTSEALREAMKPKEALKPPIHKSFPVADVTSLPTIAEPLQRYGELMDELRVHHDYHRIRVEFCHLSIILNLEGLLAPAFRPLLNTGRKFGDVVFNAIHRDRVVIDCHWLHATKQTVIMRNKDAEFRVMFRKSHPFPFDLAWDFAGNKWTKNHRATDMMRLTPFQQCQLAALQSDEISSKIKSIEHGSRKEGKSIPAPISVFEQSLNAWCERDRRISRYRDGYVAVWRARAYLGPRASIRQIGALAALMLGETPKNDKTISDRGKNIGRHIVGE